MRVIEYDYATSGYDFLDVFNRNSIRESCVIAVSSNTPTKLVIRNLTAFEQLTNCEYNYAYLSSYATGQPWMFDHNAKVPIMDAKLFIVNNVDSARSIFFLAKNCRENFAFYQRLFKIDSPPVDNVALSIANSVFCDPTGFFNITEDMIQHVSGESVGADFKFNAETKALVKVLGVNSID